MMTIFCWLLSAVVVARYELSPLISRRHARGAAGHHAHHN